MSTRFTDALPIVRRLVPRLKEIPAGRWVILVEMAVLSSLEEELSSFEEELSSVEEELSTPALELLPLSSRSMMIKKRYATSALLMVCVPAESVAVTIPAEAV